MASQLPRRRRSVALAAVAAILAGVAIPSAAATSRTPSAGPSVLPVDLTAIDPPAARHARPAHRAAPGSRRSAAIGGFPALEHPAAVATVAPATVHLPEARAGSEAKAGPQTASSRTRTSATTAYRGRNHVWIPSIGIDRWVASFPCSRSEPPGDHVYRWGCAGRNNVYLLGHAHSVFEPLHDLYVSGRLRTGMKVVYADGNGRVRAYAVSFWRVVAPDGDVGWAYAAQSRPSMTLQTCVGTRSEYRLVVRLLAVG